MWPWILLRMFCMCSQFYSDCNAMSPFSKATPRCGQVFSRCYIYIQYVSLGMVRNVCLKTNISKHLVRSPKFYGIYNIRSQLAPFNKQLPYENMGWNKLIKILSKTVTMFCIYLKEKYINWSGAYIEGESISESLYWPRYTQLQQWWSNLRIC